MNKKTKIKDTKKLSVALLKEICKLKIKIIELEYKLSNAEMYRDFYYEWKCKLEKKDTSK